MSTTQPCRTPLSAATSHANAASRNTDPNTTRTRFIGTNRNPNELETVRPDPLRDKQEYPARSKPIRRANFDGKGHLDAQQLPEYPGLAHAVLSSVVPVSQQDQNYGRARHVASNPQVRHPLHRHKSRDFTVVPPGGSSGGSAPPSGIWSGRPGESHPQAPTERSVTVSRHSALLTGSVRKRWSTPSA